MIDAERRTAIFRRYLERFGELPDSRLISEDANARLPELAEAALIRDRALEDYETGLAAAPENRETI